MEKTEIKATIVVEKDTIVAGKSTIVAGKVEPMDSQATIVAGNKLADQICNSLIPEIKSITQQLGRPPNLTVILVGNRSESISYVNSKKARAQSLMIDCDIIQFNTTVITEEILVEIDHLNDNPRVQAILVQLPLPTHINKDQVLARIKPEKDVDGFHPLNVGGTALGQSDYLVPCTPLGVMEIFKHYNVNLKGQLVILIGASRVTGLPLFHLLLVKEATVIVCHKATRDLMQLCQQADIVITACGQPEMITDELIKPGAIVIDIGINFIDHPKGRKLVGDVHFDSVKNRASLITPVPGGVGPLTVAMLMANIIRVSNKQRKLADNNFNF